MLVEHDSPNILLPEHAAIMQIFPDGSAEIKYLTEPNEQNLWREPRARVPVEELCCIVEFN